MKRSDGSILTRIKGIVNDYDPLAKVYLYGSRSQGKATNESDWDLLILLNRDYDLEFDLGEVISPMVYSEKEWNTKYKYTPFYKNVMKEGKLL